MARGARASHWARFGTAGKSAMVGETATTGGIEEREAR